MSECPKCINAEILQEVNSTWSDEAGCNDCCQVKKKIVTMKHARD